MVKSTASESLDEAFEQRLMIIDEPWPTGCRLAESRLSRRDQHAMRQGQRRPSSEDRNRIKQRKPLPANKHDRYHCKHGISSEGVLDLSVTSSKQLVQESDTAKIHIQPFCNDGMFLNDQVGTSTKRSPYPSTYSEVGISCGDFLSSDSSCSKPSFETTSTPTENGLSRCPPITNLGDRQSDCSCITSAVEGQVHFIDHVQNHKRKVTSPSKTAACIKRIRNIGFEGADNRCGDVMSRDSSHKRHYEHVGHLLPKRRCLQLTLRQTKGDEIDGVTDDIVIDAMNQECLSLQETQRHISVAHCTIGKDSDVATDT